MTYSSFDTIPVKLFFEIEKTGNLQLLTDQEMSDAELKTIWKKIEAEHEKINPNNKGERKEFHIFKQMEAVNAQYQSITNAVKYLSYKDDEELTAILKNYGYQFTGDSQKDLEKIANHSESLLIKIKRLQDQLPKPEEKKEVSIDEVILGYSVIAGSGFLDTNKITGTQYYALISIGNQKMKALENGKK